MILDPGSPMSFTGRPWLEKYLVDFDYKIEDMVSSQSYQVFRFCWIDKRHVIMLLIELPLLIKSMNGREYVLKAQVYVIDADIVFWCGKKTLEQWGSNLNMIRSILETCIETAKIDYRMITMDTWHYGKKLETQDKKETEIMYLEENENDLTT